MMPFNADGVGLLHEFESFVGHAYPDPYSPLGKALRAAGLWRKYLQAPFSIPEAMRALSGAPWTIGYGFTEGVREGDMLTRAAADVRLSRELNRYVEAVARACAPATPNDNELAAMVCLAWNIGVAGFQRSTVLRCHRAGDKAGAARAFRLWNRAGGEVSPGLERRRVAEAALYLKPLPPVGVALEEPMPQRVDAESGARHSPIVIGSTISGGAGALAAAAEVSQTIGTMRYALGDWLPWVLLALVIGGAGWVIWTRVVQRRRGWA